MNLKDIQETFDIFKQKITLSLTNKTTFKGG